MVRGRRCIVCGEPAQTALGIRARYESSNAAWAPNTGAYLCGLHTVSGLRISITIEPRDDGHVRIRARGGGPDGGKVAYIHTIGATGAGGYGQMRLVGDE